MLSTAFLLGFIGSLHCIGMCGPLTLLLPHNKGSFSHFIKGRVLYNIGRILTYSFIGLLVGFMGEQIIFFFSQKWLSLALGILILTFLFLPKTLQSKIELYPKIARFTQWVKAKMAASYKKSSLTAQFTFGIINGLLPCGLVYAALAGAFIQSSAIDGGLYMLFFGMGTLPMMLGITFGGDWIKKIGGLRLRKLIPLTYSLVAIWLIMRGLNVSIPSLYTAPNVDNIPECHT